MSVLQVVQSQHDWYSLAHVTFGISAAPQVAAALEGRLRPLRVAPLAAVDCEFEYCVIPEASEHLIPAGTGRAVLIPDQGEVLYDERNDTLSIQLTDRIRARCEVQTGRVVISTRGVGPADVWALSHPYFMVPFIELLRRRGLYYLHAAGVQINGQCVLLTGPSGAGKSTLALALALAGFGLLGDDAMFLAPAANGVDLISFPDEIDVGDGSLALLPELARRPIPARRPGWPKVSFRGEDFFPGDMVRQGRPSLLVFARISGEEKSAVYPMSRSDAFVALVPNVFLTEQRASQSHLEAFSQLVQSCDCYQISTGRDLERIPDLIRALL